MGEGEILTRAGGQAWLTVSPTGADREVVGGVGRRLCLSQAIIKRVIDLARCFVFFLILMQDLNAFAPQILHTTRHELSCFQYAVRLLVC